MATEIQNLFVRFRNRLAELENLCTLYFEEHSIHGIPLSFDKALVKTRVDEIKSELKTLLDEIKALVT